MINDSFELYQKLERLDLLKEKPLLWWPNHGTFEVIVGAILTQNTKWEKVEHSLQNLRDNNLLSLNALASADLDALMMLIRPSGLYKNKAKYLTGLCKAIIRSFGDFEHFYYEVDRDWLLKQKGIGPETADSILCYGCGRDVMVVDAYTARLLNAFGYLFESYGELQEWCRSGVADHFDSDELAEVYARFHGMIVEYVKRYSSGKKVDISKVLDDSAL